MSNKVYESKRLNSGVAIATEIATNDVPRIIANEMWGVAHASTAGYASTHKFRVPTGWFANVVLREAEQNPGAIVVNWDRPVQNAKSKEWSIARTVSIFTLEGLARIIGSDNMKPQIYSDNGLDSGWNDGSKPGDLCGGYIHLEVNQTKVIVMQVRYFETEIFI